MFLICRWVNQPIWESTFILRGVYILLINSRSIILLCQTICLLTPARSLIEIAESPICLIRQWASQDPNYRNGYKNIYSEGVLKRHVSGHSTKHYSGNNKSCSNNHRRQSKRLWPIDYCKKYTENLNILVTLNIVAKQE